MGSDPTAVDHRRRPVLQAAVANSCPLECLEILLSAPGVSVGVECRDEGSVLHALVRGRVLSRKPLSRLEHLGRSYSPRPLNALVNSSRSSCPK